MTSTVPTGSITPSDQEENLPDMETDGRCIQRTLRNIDMDDEVLSSVRLQSENLLASVMKAYVEQFPKKEIGKNGTAVTDLSAAQPVAPTGLLYGRIQSGKTVAMIGFTALAIDNGFRVVIVLTSNFVELVKQTCDRFGALARTLVYASTEADTWETDSKNMKKHMGDRGLVIVCAKNVHHLDRVKKLLKQLEAGRFPALILDDEADNASLDNNTRKRSRASEEVEPTKIHKRIAEIRSILRHHVFVQVTATPYAMLLQNVDSPARPRFAELLYPGEGYKGGEAYFSTQQLKGEGKPPVIFVEEAETKELQAGVGDAPPGLQKAVAFFLVSAAAQNLSDPAIRKKSQNFLGHTSHKKSEHDKLSHYIRHFLNHFEDQLEPLTGAARTLVHWALKELSKTCFDTFDVNDIVEDIVDRLPRRRIRIINSDANAGDSKPGVPNFIVGGNIIGRGLTIPNLLVTYYTRRPVVSQMDTMLQHARMYGYREALMPYTRVFLPHSLAVRFNTIHRAEGDLREILAQSGSVGAVPVQVVGKLRPTRYGVLDIGTVSVLRSGQHLYPSAPDIEMSTRRRKAIETVLAKYFPQWAGSTRLEAERMEFDDFLKLVEAFDVGDWSATTIRDVVQSLSVGGTCRPFISFRHMRRSASDKSDAMLLTGALSGPELKEARSRNMPTFFIFQQVKPQAVWKNKLFLYPTIVFPRTMSNQIYNITGAIGEGEENG